MAYIRLLCKNLFKKQKGTVAGVFLLILIAATCLFSAITVYLSGSDYVSREMDRLGYGDYTVWTTGRPRNLEDDILSVNGVGNVTVQPLIYSGYQINGKYSDNEGQIIPFDGTVPYKFTDINGKEMPLSDIARGTVYISPALQSSFDVDLGDTIRFELSRTGDILNLTVAGYFADGFMGSSMIDMKSFLVNPEEFENITANINSIKSADVLAKTGEMYHISTDDTFAVSVREVNKRIVADTDITLYTMFSYNKSSIQSYMLLLENVMSGFMISFSCVLLAVILIIACHNLSAVIRQDRQDIAVLKTIGLGPKQIRHVYIAIYGFTAFAGLFTGALLSKPVSGILATALVSSTGLLVTIIPQVKYILLIAAGIILLFVIFLTLSTKEVLEIPPVQAMEQAQGAVKVNSPIQGKHLRLSLAIRNVLSDKKKYISLFMISVFLTRFLSSVGKMASWLGPNGEGLMNAFSVADHDLGVQPFSRNVPMDEIERVINWYSPIQDTYEIAMQSVVVNGQDYTANVLNDTKWFHLLSGELCDGDSILITEMVANELDIAIGDTVRVSANGRTEEYTVSGIYQCANGMGSNIGMSIRGYSKIGDITGYIWCYHYILEDGGMRDWAMKYLQDNYRGVDIHNNGWSGLDGIVFVIKLLLVAIYIISGLFILVATMLTVNKLIRSETARTAIYRSLGTKNSTLKLSFSMRFFIVVLTGSVAGIILSQLLSDRIISVFFRLIGISEFNRPFGLLSSVLPLTVIPLLFFACAFAFSGKLKNMSITTLIRENEN